MKTLESSIVDRLNEMTSAKPHDRDTFVNYLDILGRAKIEHDHIELLNAVEQAAIELGMATHKDVQRVRRHIMTQFREWLLANEPTSQAG